jgi:hypothetical protein
MRQPNPEERLYRLPREPAQKQEQSPIEPRYAVTSSGSIIGWTNLEFPFPDDQRAAGIFHPAPAFARVEPVFGLYVPAEKCDKEQFQRFLCERDELRLQVVDPDAHALDAKVETIQEGSDGRHTIHVRFNDSEFFRSP